MSDTIDSLLGEILGEPFYILSDRSLIEYGPGFLEVWVDALPMHVLQKANQDFDFQFDPSQPARTACCRTSNALYTMGENLFRKEYR